MSDDARRRPTVFAVFKAFLLVGLTSVGGGGSAHLEDVIVRRRGWVTGAEFLEALTLARALPGTNVSNLASFIGCSLAGYWGAAAALAGVVLPGVAFVLAAAAAYVKLTALHSAAFGHALHGLAAGALGVMCSLVIRAARTGLKSWSAPLFAAAAFAGVVVFRLNMALVLVALVPFASLLNRERTDV